MDTVALVGRSVLVTRPRHQADGLIDAVQRLGGTARVFPTLAIVPVALSAAMIGDVQSLHAGDWAIFISPNAVDAGMGLLAQAGGLPSGVGVAAVGRATARSLHENGIARVLVPQQGADSEALLALAPLHDLTGRRVLIVRGEGGRELLGRTLVERGADLRYAEVYRRVMPEDADRSQLLAWLAAGAVDLLTATSPAGLENLVRLAGAEGGAALSRLPLVVVSERMLQQAERLGFRGSVQVAEGAGDDAITKALVALTEQR